MSSEPLRAGPAFEGRKSEPRLCLGVRVGNGVVVAIPLPNLATGVVHACSKSPAAVGIVQVLRLLGAVDFEEVALARSTASAGFEEVHSEEEAVAVLVERRA